MRRIRQTSIPCLIAIFTFGILLCCGARSHAAGKAVVLVSASGTSNTLGDRPAKKGDKELEDTIRELNRFTLSDSLWKMWRAIEDSQYVVARIDTIKAQRSFQAGAKLAKEAFTLLQQIKQSDLDSLTRQKIILRAILLFEKARTEFEQTFKTNPFDIKTQTYLIWVFQNLAELYDHCDSTLRAIQMLEYLTYILNDDPKLYYALGEKYFNIGKWDLALAKVRTSIDLMLNNNWDSIDRNQLFWHYYLRANAEINLNMIPQALLSLNYAKLIAPSAVEADDIQKKIDWINWDDGNLPASRKSDSLDMRLNQGTDNYGKIKQDYLNLLSQVRTDNAKMDVNWRIAQLEFNFLQQRENAVERMSKVVKQIPLDSIKKAVDPNFQKYIDDYCLMCYILGMEYVNQQDFRKAFVYFFQSTVFNWSQAAKSYLQLAKLSALDNLTVLRFGQQALNCEQQLSEQERGALYHILFMAYKRMGRFEEALFWNQKAINYSLSNYNNSAGSVAR
ncbi:MAG: hypothetical protein ONB16_07935 [candidate division KSB1 bacterium]|nr:hypothetical protein [candidate division KSB1 bacterium]MDZ7318674.1 hypothetical protein [candidate division KSB1 bacterium]